MPLPKPVKTFIDAQQIIPVSELVESSEPTFPYSEHVYRAVLGMLLSGRVASKYDGYPNKTDITRICKEANFNQYLFENLTKRFLCAEIIKPVSYAGYEVAENLEAFLKHDLKGLQNMMRLAFRHLVGENTPTRLPRQRTWNESGLDEFVTLFFSCFDGLAIPYKHAGKIFLEFSNLPKEALERACRLFTIDKKNAARWDCWLDEDGQQALIEALFRARWAYVDKTEEWLYLNDTGRIMLGMDKPPSKPGPIEEFKALPNFCVFAGSSLPMETLVPLFRFCKIQRIDRVFEFKIDKNRIQNTPVKPEICSDLATALSPLNPLPDTIRKALEGKSKLQGEFAIRLCSAIIKPESQEQLDAIRQHPKLKNYILSEGPPGYLLIKPGSDPRRFVMRCHELGLKYEAL